MMQLSFSTTLASVFVLGVLGSTVATGQEPSAKIIEYGRYRTTVTALKPTEEKVSGSVTVETKEQTHLETTRKIPCKVGEVFGCRVEFSNLPKDRDYVLKDETHHPPIKQPDGAILTKSVSVTKLKAGTIPDGFSAWHFLKGFEYELVTGKWTRRTYIDDKEVASMTFDVEK